ncbi:imidazole glycerol phosphate synthase subunit HisH [Paenibacillus agilis]|uniref:Imidazole glycerol phosphate synthase subunit HisH n=1 Tax=Paenibacillus agilis TaxID=3020863 RepID=A0A559IK78_9BACL|nr:imidazole glycerol phosphate synthase subunit HisH [Paenibacillus agilis]TVX88027.1 imidazole glycerol phosphate synthase subunit HisH [Paenibacillus agilis]
MIAIVDYGMGNLHSVSKAIERLGREATIVSEVQPLHSATGIILPGVGAFGDAMDALHATGLGEELRKLVQQGKPLLGICLGMQLLFDSSEEYGQHKGLGLLPGKVVRFPQTGYKVPHMGWNSLAWKNPNHTLVKELEEDYVYFVHSYHVEVEEPSDLLATTEYADREVTAIVARDNVYGMQFHPEKSGSLGLKLLEQFLTKVVAVSISNK